jgi:hypothetical protein
MSDDVIHSRLAFEQTIEGRWLVYLGNRHVFVQTRNDAELIASLPVELAKFSSGRIGKSDIARARKIVKLCESYNLHTKVSAVRMLDAFIQERQRPKI